MFGDLGGQVGATALPRPGQLLSLTVLLCGTLNPKPCAHTIDATINQRCWSVVSIGPSRTMWRGIVRFGEGSGEGGGGGGGGAVRRQGASSAPARSSGPLSCESL